MLHGLQVKTKPKKIINFHFAVFINVLTSFFLNLFVLCLSPCSVSWRRPAQTPSACLTCAGTTTRSRQPPSFTVFSSSRSSKPSKSPRLSPTATSLPQLDQNFTSFRHWKNNTLLVTGLKKNNNYQLCLFVLFVYCQNSCFFFPFWGGVGSEERVGNF